jgi:hypothetical protein
MTYPRTYFQSPHENEQPGTCFVLMPFAQDFGPVYDTILDALESSEVGFHCRRADELFGGDQIMAGVLREIASAQLIIADLTSRNPNVFYELGIAHMTKKAERVLLLAQRVDDVPFDLSAFRCIVYSSDERGLRELRRRLTAAVREIAGSTYRFELSRGESHTTGPQFPAPDRCLYSLEVSELMIGRDFVKCRVRTDRHAIGQPTKTIQNTGYGLQKGEARKLPKIPWSLRLDSIAESRASFSVVPTEESEGDAKDSSQSGIKTRRAANKVVRADD